MTTRLTAAFALALAACSGGEAPSNQAATDAKPAEAKPKAPPVFSLAWSEYPSWSTFGVAHELGLIHKKKGEMGEMEKKWGVDIELKEADYDTCISMYGSGQVDAAALTNMDSLPIATSKPTVGILPTSTSFGGDALITSKDVTELAQLKGKPVRGLENSVSQYTFERNVEIAGLDAKDFTFKNADPGAAAMAMQQKQDGFEAIVVWNPFVMATLNKRDDVHVLADSKAIPGEIIDMVVMSQTSLDKPGADAFAHAIIDTFYAISDRIEDEKTRDETLIKLGEKFAKLDVESMKTIVDQTRFYKTPDEALALYGSEELKTVMGTVVEFELSHGMLKDKPEIGYGKKDAAPTAAFRFDSSYIEAVKAKK
jgi:NitT/TauT family transport system substrate-binding protein